MNPPIPSYNTSDINNTFTPMNNSNYYNNNSQMNGPMQVP